MTDLKLSKVLNLIEYVLKKEDCFQWHCFGIRGAALFKRLTFFLVYPWPNEQTLFTTNITFACQTMFSCLAMSQDIVGQ